MLLAFVTANNCAFLGFRAASKAGSGNAKRKIVVFLKKLFTQLNGTQHFFRKLVIMTKHLSLSAALSLLTFFFRSKCFLFYATGIIYSCFY